MMYDLPLLKEIVCGIVVGIFMLLFKSKASRYYENDQQILNMKFENIWSKLESIEENVKSFLPLHSKISIIEERLKSRQERNKQ